MFEFAIIVVRKLDPLTNDYDSAEKLFIEDFTLIMKENVASQRKKCSVNSRDFAFKLRNFLKNG